MSEAIELDFSDVKDFGNPARNVVKGNYLLKVNKISKETSKAGNPMWVVDAEFVDGVNAGETIREYLALTEKALFKVKSWLDAVHGQTLPKKKIKLPNTSAALQTKFGGRIYGAHVDAGDPRIDNQGNEVTYPEIKYHMFAALVKGEQAPDVEEKVEEKAADDVSEQLAAFDLDSL